VRIINFAHGEVLMLAMYATFFRMRSSMDPYLSLLVPPAMFFFGVLP
jgi:branched-subunit amino acid ABC-type transport system permease component